MKRSEHAFCCDSMDYYLNEFTSPDGSDNPDVIVKHIPKFDEYGIPIYDGGSSMITINFCPWCGTKLPESKRELWFDTLEKMGIDIHEGEIPKEFQSSAWFQNKT